MKNRIFAVLLAVVMVLAVLPTAVFAEDTATVYIAGTEYTSNYDSDTVDVDFTNRIITLTNANITYTASTAVNENNISVGITNGVIAGIVIMDDSDWSLNLVGDNSITVSDNTSGSISGTAICGIYANNSLSISEVSTGKLGITVTPQNKSTFCFMGIFAEGLTVNSGEINVTLTTNGGSSMFGALTSLGESFKMISGNVTVNSDVTMGSGIYTVEYYDIDTNTFSGVSKCEFSGGHFTAVMTGSTSYGIKSDYGDIAISGEQTQIAITATANSGVGFEGNNVDITGGTVILDVSSFILDVSSFGIATDIYTGTVDISGNANLNIENSNVGIRGNDVDITGGIVDITAEGEGIRGTQEYNGSKTVNVNLSADSLKIVTTTDTGKAISVENNSTVTISDGSFTGEINAGTNSNVTVSGGSYSEPVNPDYLHKDLNVELNTNGVYTYHESVEEVKEIIENSDDENMSFTDFTPVDGDRPDRDEAETKQYVTVTINPNNGANTTTEQKYTGDIIDSLTTPILAGYNFLGWSDGTSIVTFPYTVAGNVTLTAQWDGIKYTVTLNPNNGEAETITEIPYGVPMQEPTAPVKPGYNFIGWSADGVTTVSFPYTVTANTTLTALWEEIKQNNNDYWMAMLMYMMMNQKFDITATVTEGGTISDAGVAQIQRGKDATYTITPDEGYAIADVSVDGVSVGAVSVYTFDNVKKAHTIEAVFVKTAWVNPYSDVSENDWFYEDIEYVTENGIMNGVIENDTFAPDATATRAMLVTILWRLEGEPIVDTPVDFLDVSADEWYTDAVNWASANGIVLGYEGLFNPENALTREQIAAILHRYAAYKGIDDGIALPMVAQYECSVWAENDVIWADMNGLFDGIGNDMRDMTEDATRAEVAAMLRRLCD